MNCGERTRRCGDRLSQLRAAVLRVSATPSGSSGPPCSCATSTRRSPPSARATRPGTRRRSPYLTRQSRLTPTRRHAVYLVAARDPGPVRGVASAAPDATHAHLPLAGRRLVGADCQRPVRLGGPDEGVLQRLGADRQRHSVAPHRLARRGNGQASAPARRSASTASRCSIRETSPCSATVRPSSCPTTVAAPSAPAATTSSPTSSPASGPTWRAREAGEL